MHQARTTLRSSKRARSTPDAVDPASRARTPSDAAPASCACRPTTARTTSATAAPSARSSSVSRWARASSPRASCSESFRRATLVVAQGVDQLVLVHVRAPLDADLGGPLLEVVLVPVLVGRRLAALVRLGLGVGVRDPRRLLLGRALVPKRLVLLVVLYGWSVVFGHA